ncbi:MAG: hypothetical protein WAK84_13385 [Candidatus Cybelea sp.]
MTARLRVALVPGVLTLLVSACANGGNLQPNVAAQTDASLTRPAKERVTITQFADLPRYYNFYFPTAVTVGPDGALWVTDDIDQDAGQSAIARIETSGKRTNAFYYQNDASPSFEDIAAGPDGALWITDSGDGQILRMTTTGTFTTYPLNNADAEGIVAGPDHALWFVENYFQGAAVGRITTSGKITYFSAGISSGATLHDITLGPDGALWFTESNGDRVGRVTKRGKITEYSAGITPGSEPYAITAGSDGALWFTEIGGGRIGRITTSGTVTEYSQGITLTERPAGIAAGPDGALWFTEYESYGSYQIRASKIGRITTNGKISEYSKLKGKSEPVDIVNGPDGNMWFVETNADKMGRVTL